MQVLYSTTLLHNLIQHSTTIAARLQTSGGWEVGAVVGTKCRGGLSMWTVVHPPSTPPTQTHGTIHSSRHVVPRCHRRAAPCTAGPAARRRGAQLRIARLEGRNFRGIQMQTRGNFLTEQRKLWKVVESFPLQLDKSVGNESQANRSTCGEQLVRPKWRGWGCRARRT